MSFGVEPQMNFGKVAPLGALRRGSAGRPFLYVSIKGVELVHVADIRRKSSVVFAALPPRTRKIDPTNFLFDRVLSLCRAR